MLYVKFLGTVKVLTVQISDLKINRFQNYIIMLYWKVLCAFVAMVIPLGL